jgi:hypothetical protein
LCVFAAAAVVLLFLSSAIQQQQQQRARSPGVCMHIFSFTAGAESLQRVFLSLSLSARYLTHTHTHNTPNTHTQRNSNTHAGKAICNMLKRCGATPTSYDLRDGTHPPHVCEAWHIIVRPPLSPTVCVCFYANCDTHTHNTLLSNTLTLFPCNTHTTHNTHNTQHENP